MVAADARNILSFYKNLSTLDKLHIYIRMRRLPFEVIEKYVPQEGRVLDFGCGHGFFSLYLSNKSRNRKVLGVDISKRKIQVAALARHGKNVSFKYSPNTKSFLDNKAYECIVIINVLYLLKREDQERLLDKASKALVKNGKLLIIEPDASLKFRTFYEIMRESIMIRILGLTKGTTLTYNKKQWWLAKLRKYFSGVEIKSFKDKKHHLLYICSK